MRYFKAIVCALALVAIPVSAYAGKKDKGPLWTGMFEGGYAPVDKENVGVVRGDIGLALLKHFGPHGHARNVHREGWAAFAGLAWIARNDDIPFGERGRPQNLHLAFDLGTSGRTGGGGTGLHLALSGMWTYVDGVSARFRLEAPKRDLLHIDYEADLTGMTPFHLGSVLRASRVHGIGTGVAFGVSFVRAWAAWMPLDPHGHDLFMPARFAAGLTAAY